MVYFNWIGIAQLVAALVLSLVVGVGARQVGIHQPNHEMVGFIAGGLLLVAVDLPKRRNSDVEDKFRWVRPSAGGHISFIPMWILGALTMVLCTGQLLASPRHRAAPPPSVSVDYAVTPPAETNAPAPAAASLDVTDPAHAKHHAAIVETVAALKASITKLGDARDLAALESQNKSIAATCAQLPAEHAFLSALATPSATTLRGSADLACARQWPVALVKACTAAIAKQPAKKKALCALGGSGVKTLDAAHETENNQEVSDALVALSKACL